ncbi:MAG: amidohydrolase [Sphingomonadales bacterium 35-56-22]|jgi:N-acyl-D-aspartate/D-glutamate deacylase|uniref:N-acyl-D-amino-acid deacylase family protein n=1 Tax=Sphingorhabdus sp. TaxID=1902408 RepID=UPI000BC8836A|nr:D-aminoacylase [Sphingorhabdus sp.]OYY16735.1 MAG: amidohydrolase [Sphingomonadales bacterium 35-56-22]OYY98895.1 MAG: amidohydrolase [Sphingomonadales bacterium 28-56-43]OYZ60364.1 MAG: amidohydrolase [Sphingomonadales bacterium 24-56-14]HQS12151.1 D-aminoacylase [Sphingorhabdus sp.]HQS79649.1 D-aminoacylase [Sphingorhabdus sp.]
MHDLVIRGGTVVDGTGAPRFVADVAVDGGIITAMGQISASGREEIDASGKIVAPGFVDIHTHYDGQATWDSEMGPSSWHGVTTVVMGNCGVGFAPAKKDKHDWLIGLMEGVEDIPGTALAEGMKWDWESFPDYLDALERLPRTIDIGTQVPHGALRAFVMGQRGADNEEPTEADIAEMARLVEEGLRAGALGFSTSRTVLHKSIDGELVPGTTATEPELVGIGRAMGKVGHGVFELTTDFLEEWDEFGWMGRLSRETGLPIAFTMLQSPIKQMPWTEQMAAMCNANDNGANLVAAIGLRGIGVIMNWRGTVHPFMRKPSWQKIAGLSWDEQKAKLSDPAFKAAMLAEDNLPPPSPDMAPFFMLVTAAWAMQFPLGDGFSYEPTREESVFGFAQAAGKESAEYAYDQLMADDGNGMIYLPILNYMDGNLDFTKELLQRDDIVASLSDGGAHCGTICDAASPTFLLSYWARDRKAGTIPLELAVKRQCHDTARLYGLNDRGVLKPGYLADINVIDFDALKLLKPWLAFDLPAGGKRLLQKADGYAATIKSGVVTFRDGAMTGALPGIVVRGPQSIDMAEAAE